MSHEHHHHGIGKHEADEPLNFSGGLDAGSKSLADALRISFAVLKIIMVVLVILFFSSGVFTVAPDERAMVLRFGRIRGDTTEKRILGPGLHWAIPYPIEEVIKLPARNTVLRTAIDSFWYNERNKLPPASLDPIIEGYSITRNDTIADLKGGSDYNIVHSKWNLTYRIADCELFFKNVSVKMPAAGQTLIDVIPQSVEPFLKAVTSEAIVVTMVNFSIDEAIKSDSRIGKETEKLLQQKLDDMNSGIEVDSMQLTAVIWPRQVNDAFVASIKASNEADRMIREAKGHAESKINEAGGEEMVNGVLSPNTTDEQKEYFWNNASGTVQQVIAEAKAYRTKVVESAKANADYLQKLLPEYRKRPKLVVQRIYQDAIEEVLSNTQETIIAQPSSGVKNRELRIMVNRDPSIGKKKQEEKK
ncbi:MAG: protease modulator HflK [Planctomycetes bacterium]|nr:protease modulator HflK [Planctomycetota bacterium]MBU1517945.1 protease modulator HflK [Planctomycetota bacterium]MBU2458331.1 protease modulator HflK [Planctomycetota bacterium]